MFRRRSGTMLADKSAVLWGNAESIDWSLAGQLSSRMCGFGEGAMLAELGCTEEDLRRRSGTTQTDKSAFPWGSAETIEWSRVGQISIPIQAVAQVKGPCWRNLSVLKNIFADALALCWPTHQHYHGAVRKLLAGVQLAKLRFEFRQWLR